MNFSQRIGKSPVREALQVDSMDVRLTTQLWNALWNSFFIWIVNDKLDNEYDRYCRKIWSDFLNNTIDSIPVHHNSNDIKKETVVNIIKEWYFKNKWHSKYDLVEFISKLLDESFFDDHCNIILKKEMSGYRLIGNLITSITSEEEIIEIERAFDNTSKWQSVNTHLKRSLEFLSNRDEPDFRNSLKESISSVEAMCEIILDKKTTLGAALASIAKNYDLDPTLKKAFSVLYGHASNTGGARHNLSEEDSLITMEYARYMLISCSAFINYLKTKSEKV